MLLPTAQSDAMRIEGQRARNVCGLLASDRPQRWGALVTASSLTTLSATSISTRLCSHQDRTTRFWRSMPKADGIGRNPLSLRDPARLNFLPCSKQADLRRLL